MALLSIETIDRDGLLPTLVAATAAGDTWNNTGSEFIIVDNASGGNLTVTLDIIPTTDGQTVADRTVVIPTGEQWFIGPFPKNFYNDGTGLAKISYSTDTSVTVGVVKLSTT